MRKADRHDEYSNDDRSALGRPGGDWAGMRPTIDNPFTWALPLGRIGGISVRVHLLFILFVIVQLSWAALNSKGLFLNVKLTGLAMGVLFVMVLIHEFGHCLACRSSGGIADEILMWPLGGLAFCQPQPVWQAHFMTALGGPLVNLVVCALAGSMLGVLTGQWWGIVVPNLLDPFAVLADPNQPVSRSMAHMTLYMVNVISVILLAFNLLPMFPLDGGRMLQALLWPRMGWSRSMRAAVRLGYLAALAIGIFGAITQNWMVVGISLFGLWSCWNTHRQLEFSDSMLAEIPDDEYAMSVYSAEEEDEQRSAVRAVPDAPSRAQSVAARQAQQEQDENREVDRILDKIAHQGIHSLTRGEHSLLERATERKRKQS